MNRIICTKLLKEKNGKIDIKSILNLIPNDIEIFLFKNNYGIWLQTVPLNEELYDACKKLLGDLVYENENGENNRSNISDRFGYIISEIGLNVRKNDSVYSDIISVLDFGQRFKIIDEVGEWYKISSPEIGYISKQYTNIETKEINQVSNELIKFTASWEGFSSVPYKDAGGNWTVGFGDCTYNTKPAPVTLEEAMSDLENTLNSLAKEVFLITKDLNLTQYQFDSLVDFSYNLGINALKRSDLLQNIIECLDNNIIINDFTAWSYCDGKKLWGLERRRLAEANMFLYRKYINN
ncbi:glycoside hydrolase family protein [Clostridium massiliamazoniense]|uniref:glycoside hydrolase family protein n=1 Tax=Clostridium massiliamazoniense TaxID=1347366 RepID=UPI0006D80770|nr:SH3 domain-containing protein [Clostridium massiliamazoniense]